MQKKLFLLSLLLLQIKVLSAQDLFFEVKVDATAANTSETRVFTSMENSFKQFMNDRNWVEQELEPFERIKGVMAISIISIPKTGQFETKMQVQSVRPVYNSTYESVMFNSADLNFTFDYVESQPMDYSPNGFNEQLVSVLAFYANLITGLDMDSYSELGGQAYYDEALDIARSANQQRIGSGWDQFGNINSRFALIQSILNSQLEPVRQALYLYHREGLDLMHEKPEEARANIIKALENIQKANKINPNEPFVTILMQTKVDEIISIFKEGDISLRRKAYNIMRDIAPANSERYEAMLN